MRGLTEHAQRADLSAEIHARPFETLRAPLRVSHLALLSGDDTEGEERAAIRELCGPSGREPHPGVKCFSQDLGSLRLRWERHTEFSTFTVFERVDPQSDQAFSRDPFDHPPVERLPEDWLRRLPGECLVSTTLALMPRDGGPDNPEWLDRLFGSDTLAGSSVTGGAARAFTDFRIHPDGHGRILVQDRRLMPRQAGRLVQRLLEVETYRMMALLALPIARSLEPELRRIDRALAGTIDRLSPDMEDENHERALRDITELAAESERLSARGSQRFSAARAYYALVERRLSELREERIEGIQTLVEMMERRHTPAMRTCQSVEERQGQLAVRIGRAATLLRTRVEVALQRQNRDLLEGMNRRARMQMRLQETVETLSVAAISYYLVSLLGYLLRGFPAEVLPLPVAALQALAVPLVAGLAFLGLHQVRRRIRKQA